MHILKDLLFGLLFGWGVAIPIGPINLEIIRRNLNSGFWQGLAFGMGACLADITYIILIFIGAVTVLAHPNILRWISIVGAIILMGFACATALSTTKFDPNAAQTKQQQSLLSHFLSAAAVTLFNPSTILFWVSVGAQIAHFAQQGLPGELSLIAGVFLGVGSWMLFFNLSLHLTRHKLSSNAIKILNYVGAGMLFIFGLISLSHAI